MCGAASFHGRSATKHRGFTLVELIMFIVIVGIGLAGILAALNQSTSNSADPQVRKQALAIAQSLLEEISLQAFTYCDPDDPNVETATSAALGPGPLFCATETQTTGPGAGESSRARFDNVIDYNGLNLSPISDIAGNPIAGLAGYTVQINVTPTALGSVPAGDALRIRVTVNGPTGVQIALEGYRTRYAPNAAP